MRSNRCAWVGVVMGMMWAVAAHGAVVETGKIRFEMAPENGAWRVVDKEGGVVWGSNPFKPRFGEATLVLEGKKQVVELGKCEVREAGKAIEAVFRSIEGKEIKARVELKGENGLAFSYEGAGVESVRLVDGVWVTGEEKGYVVAPVREGLLIPADSGLEFAQTFDTYAYEGCHMTMMGVVKNGAAALITWDDPYVAAEVRSRRSDGKQTLTVSMGLRKSAKGCAIRFLGKGDYATIAKAYREVAKEKGWVVTWDQKLVGHPERAKYFGASNYKLWSVLSRRMNEDSTKEESVRVNWTFDEAAQVAEHLKNDLKMDKVLFGMGGWIRRGYDNQHPDILPAAPECGGDEKFAECAKRVRAQGYILALHDNYQDMYKDAPSWDESFIQKQPGGGLTKGGHWAGGVAYITCAQKAVELAKRPQNLPAVKKLTDADSYFIDTTYAAGLQECFDPQHPLTRLDDMKWKQAISDYAREVFGSFGSECGREWAIPHADFFEGLTGVSGTYYHNKELVGKVGGTVVPLFEMVYRDCIAMYGKYGYDINNSAEYVIHHISIGRPLHYHNIPSHLYWKQPVEEGLVMEPAVAEVKQTGAREFAISYRWKVEKAPAEEWSVFVHFTDEKGTIKFQGDGRARPAVTQWGKGELNQGPYRVRVPEGLSGTFDVRVGLYQPAGGQRARLRGKDDGERRIVVGRIRVNGDEVAFVPVEKEETKTSDAGLFARGDGGWTAGMHPMDRFVKNTHEILSPLNEITATMRMTKHQFLTGDRMVRRSAFGEGDEAVVVVVNGGREPYTVQSRLGGEVVLPPYGFVVEGKGFAAFCAMSWGGMRYERPAMFTMRSLEGKDLREGGKVRVFHGFGENRVRVGGVEKQVEREVIVE